MKKNIAKNYHWIIIFLFITAYISKNDLTNLYFSDAGVKVLQAFSLVHNKFQSEDLYYPLKSLDPEYRYFPIPDAMTFINNEAISQYPVLFSIIASPLVFFSGIKYLYVIPFIFSLLTLLVLQKFWKFSPLMILLTAFCTPLLIWSVAEFTETTAFVFFVALSFSMYFRETEIKKQGLAMFLGGVAGAVSIALRVESVLFFTILFFFILLNTYSSEKGNIAKTIASFFRENFAFLSGLVAIALLIFIINYSLYGHPFGVRYLRIMAHEQRLPLTLTQQLSKAFVLLFFGYMKTGYFSYVPLFLFSWIYLFLPGRYSRLPYAGKILFPTTIAYLLVATIGTPTEGFANWGPRYLSLGFIPNAILVYFIYLTFRQSLLNSRLKIAGFIFLIIISLVITYQGLQIIKSPLKQMKMVTGALATIDEDYLIAHEPLALAHLQPLYYRKKIASINTPEYLNQYLQSLAKTHATSSILLLEQSEELKNFMNQSEKHPDPEKSGWMDKFWFQIKNITRLLDLRGMKPAELSDFYKILDKYMVLKETRNEKLFTYKIYRFKNQ